MQGVQQQGVQAPHGAPEPFRRRLSNWLARSIQRFRLVLVVVLVAAAAFFVAYVIYDQVSRKVAADAALAAESAQKAYATWSAETDTAKKATEEKDLRAQLDALVAHYPRQYGGQRGLFIRAGLGYDTRAWDAARKDYEALAARFPGSYLAPVSLFNAAQCAEEAGDLTAAQSLYVKVADSYGQSVVAPRALFNAGRVAEAQSSWTQAQATYEKIDTQYSGSMWDTLAKDRLTALKVANKIK